ncbi:MAG: hypothetical protein JSV41_12890 [Gemmatimonadota bacterium]|nr:MAG: hypothetical protein JSV41_12890 [Gemmatimonadota bacterium]
MLGLYILAAILGGGLLLFSVLSGAHHDVGHVDASGLHADLSGVDADVSGVDVHADHDIHVAHDAAGELVLGLFRPRNIIFFLTAFGFTGTLLTLFGNPANLTFVLALGMGGGAMLLTHTLFTWLRRSEIGIDALSEREIEGCTARVVLPLSPGGRGRVACVIADREHYITARLAADVSESVAAGSEVVILHVEEGVAEVVPFDVLELPPPER